MIYGAGGGITFNAADVPDTKIVGVPPAGLDARQFSLTQSLRALLVWRGRLS